MEYTPRPKDAAPSTQPESPAGRRQSKVQLRSMSYEDGAAALSTGAEATGGGVITTGGTVSDVSWGETAGLYPTTGKGNLYNPERWDQGLLAELLSARAAIHMIGNERNPAVHRSMPSGNALEQKLAAYHYVENFPGVDAEIAGDPAVKYFYLSGNPNAKHTGIRGGEKVKHYGPFYNVGGGDAGGSSIYLIFYRSDA